MPNAQLIDGKAIAEQIHSETRVRAQALLARGITPCIIFIRVGDDPASQAYVRMKGKKAAELGIRSETLVFPSDLPEADLLAKIHELNADASVHGILVQAPLPSQISETVVFSTVSPQKDVDGFNPVNVGLLLLGAENGFRSCTPAGVHELLIRSNIPTAGAEVVILGRGNIVGKPLTAILLQKAKHANATVTLLHSRSKNIAEHCRRADIIVAAMGQAHFVKADMVKPGAVVIDVGVNRMDDPTDKRGYKLVGDVDFEALLPIAGHITPNPGGVGPMTIAMLLSNTVLAAEKLSA
ncbi:MAG: bifunctional 5,10-methylenetetrahydrofolate dehydrogenase/5,10-methenyltetrahydrofolate cyclohydrolase [Candidatus Methylacidiphilales bacterium]|nr:tetrahydrofolate dehydrogenase/cyclohydrolase catalytic domain-containing protein [Candidatus Methylacidiphilales bacterium]